MNTQNILKIKQAVQEAKKYPNPIIEYNFDEKISLKLFENVNIIENKSMTKNSAKVIYKLT